MVAEGARRRVVVEVCNARNLMPKDGQGTACAYAVVDFDGQRRRTATQPRDLNPQWGERLEFLVHDPGAMAAETLELNLYNDKKAIAAAGSGRRSGTFLGKVKVAGASFAKEGEEALVYYPLEKRSVFSQIRGEIGLKIWFVDEAPPPPPAEEKGAAAASDAAGGGGEKKEAAAEAKSEEKKPDDAAAAPAEEKKPTEEKKPAEEAAKTEEKKPAEGDSKDKKDDKGGKKKSPEKGKKDGGDSKPKEEEKKKDEDKKKDAPPPPSPSKQAAPPPSPSKKELAVAGGVAGDLEIRPQSAADKSIAASGTSASYDLVDRVPYLFVRLLKAKRHSGSGGPLYAQLTVGTHAVRTRAATAAGEWDLVFAFHKDSLTDTSLDVSVHEEAKKPEKKEGEEGASPCSRRTRTWAPSPSTSTRRRTCVSPTPTTAAKAVKAAAFPELYVKAQLGAQVFKTGRVPLGSAAAGASNPSWNEDLLFVAAEPFDPVLVVAVEDAFSGHPVGQARVPLSTVPGARMTAWSRRRGG
ncbi:hypothetical protein PR202_gb11565 [Eleusine coracana subsp. coracana]|uniref:C2 domain-containing protein n=1 Tax=Eleusine coracana subsp. coracana TaxID=191504 RepID=A0AAV5ENK4_ELECO|nr:hypothetical protein PR202_gb11565 [Eleusine coracana subsp. coracana]